MSDVLQQLCAIDDIHLGAESHFPRTEIFVHVMESMSHGIYCINNKLDFPLLFIGRIFPNPLMV